MYPRAALRISVAQQMHLSMAAVNALKSVMQHMELSEYSVEAFIFPFFG